MGIIQTILNEVSTLLVQLGVNQSFYFHFVIFVIAFGLLKVIIFDPYVAALEERDRRTVGGEQLAAETVNKTEELQRRFEMKAKEINNKISMIYSEHETRARKEYDDIVSEARRESAAELETSRQKISTEVSRTRAQLEPHISEIAQNVTSQLIRG